MKKCSESEVRRLLNHQTKPLRTSDQIYRKSLLQHLDDQLSAFSEQKGVKHINERVLAMGKDTCEVEMLRQESF